MTDCRKQEACTPQEPLRDSEKAPRATVITKHGCFRCEQVRMEKLWQRYGRQNVVMLDADTPEGLALLAYTEMVDRQLPVLIVARGLGEPVAYTLSDDFQWWIPKSRGWDEAIKQ